MLRSEMPAVGWFITLMPFVMLLLVLFFMYRSKKINLEGDERNVRMKLAASYGTFWVTFILLMSQDYFKFFSADRACRHIAVMGVFAYATIYAWLNRKEDRRVFPLTAGLFVVITLLYVFEK